MNSPLFTLTNLVKTYPDSKKQAKIVLDHINLTIYEGEFLILLGPSGCGKSTLLRLLSGLEKDYAGSIERTGHLNPHDVSFVFQQFALLPWLTVEQNAAMGLVTQHMSDHERHIRVSNALHKFGLGNYLHAYPRELSGGMRQRVGIARAFATEPKIIFMDEPFSELDSFIARELRNELLAMWEERKPTIVMVTHLIEEAITLADRIAVLSPRPSKIERIVINDLPRPRNIRSEESFKLEDQLYSLIKP